MRKRCWRIMVGAALAAFGTSASADVIARWECDEGSGQALLDSSGNGLHGFLGRSGDPDGEDPLRISGLDGSPGALRMSGTGFAQVPYSPMLQPAASITVSALIRPAVESQRRRIVTNLQRLGDNTYSGYNLDIQEDHLRFQIFDPSGNLNYVLAAFDFRPGEIYEVAGTWDQAASTMDVYVNGDSLADSIVEGSRNTTIQQIGPNQGSLFIGATSFGPSELFLGDIDHVVIDSEPIPEPATILLAGLSAVIITRARRRLVDQTED